MDAPSSEDELPLRHIQLSAWGDVCRQAVALDSVPVKGVMFSVCKQLQEVDDPAFHVLNKVSYQSIIVVGPNITCFVPAQLSSAPTLHV